MEPNETMVDEQVGTEADDTPVEEPIEEEQDESEEIPVEPETDGEGEPAEEQEPEPKGPTEPGWIKKRVEKAVQRAVSETESRMRDEFERQMAPIREKMLEDEARELVRKGTVKDLETAKELVRYRQGQPQAQPKKAESQQPRNERGQFTGHRQAATDAKIAMLTHQVERIKGSRGIDVTEAFMNDPDVKQKVVSGEWDFYDVADHLESKKARPQRKAPAPMRSPNGASGSEKSSIASMSDEQFERFEKRVKGGERFNAR